MSFGVFANIPEGIPSGKITAFVTSFEADGSDSGLVPDDTPDSIPLDGAITITPRVGTMNWPNLPKPQKSVMSAMVCPVFEGDLYRPGTTKETYGDVEPGVYVIATEQPDAQPSTVQYEVRWDLTRARVQPPSMFIEVPAGGTVDLATVIPASPEPGTVVVVSTEDRERAEVAAAAAAADAATASAKAAAAASSATAAQTARTGAETAATAAEASAAAVATGNFALKSDLGWESIDPAANMISTLPEGASVTMERVAALGLYRLRYTDLTWGQSGSKSLGQLPGPYRPAGVVIQHTNAQEFLRIVGQPYGAITWELGAARTTPISFEVLWTRP